MRVTKPGSRESRSLAMKSMDFERFITGSGSLFTEGLTPWNRDKMVEKPQWCRFAIKESIVQKGRQTSPLWLLAFEQVKICSI